MGAHDIAQMLVELSWEQDGTGKHEADPLTNLRLQKLLYYAQAWSLVVRESQLFPEEIEAWKYGPIVPKVYRALPEQGKEFISSSALAQTWYLTDDEKEFLKSFWQDYRDFSASKLCEMTHREQPYLNAWRGRSQHGDRGNPVISVDDMQAYFLKQDCPPCLAEFKKKRQRLEQEAEERLKATPPLDVEWFKSIVTCSTPGARANRG